MQPLQVCIGPIIRIGRESWCLPYAGFFMMMMMTTKTTTMAKKTTTKTTMPVFRVFPFTKDSTMQAALLHSDVWLSYGPESKRLNLYLEF